MRLTSRTVLALLTLGAAGLALAGCSLLGTVTDDNVQPTATAAATDPFAITVGECFSKQVAGAQDGTVEAVSVVDCAKPHEREAYASSVVPDGDYPGEQAILDQGNTDCVNAFNTFVGVNYPESTLKFTYYYPTKESWTKEGDREILCLILDPEGPVTGTLEGAAR